NSSLFEEFELKQEKLASQELEKWGEKQEKILVRKINYKKERKIKNIQRDLEKLKMHGKLYELANDHDRLMKNREIDFHGIKFKFGKNLNAHQRADLIYK